jgi:hypothetical protein
VDKPGVNKPYIDTLATSGWKEDGQPAPDYVFDKYNALLAGFQSETKYKLPKELARYELEGPPDEDFPPSEYLLTFMEQISLSPALTTRRRATLLNGTSLCLRNIRRICKRITQRFRMGSGR